MAINQINNNAIILEGAISVLSALDSEYSKILKIIIKQGVSNRNTQKILSAAKTKKIKTEFFSSDEIQELARKYFIGKTHGGIIALTEKRRYLSPEDLTAQNKTIAIIEGIEDPYNLGYAVRALYTQGIDGLIIPERDFGFSESIIEKASTGTFYKMPVAVFSNNKLELIKLLKANNFKIYCINHKAPAGAKIEVRDIFDVKFADRAVFIIGGEKRGISKDFLNNADEIVKIPYAKDFSHSLAAQTAATIVAYELHRQGKTPAAGE